MRVLRVAGATALFLLVGTAVPAFAQDERPAQETKPDTQQQPPKPVENKDKAKPAKPAEQPKSAKQAPQEKPANQVKQEEAGKTAAQAHPSHTASEVQRQSSVPALRLSARGTGRIPDDKFRANFGSEHRFHMGAPKLVAGYSRFQYSGFWFGFVDPWPVDWYYTDAVYVDYIDGAYYLCDPYYPGVHISISVVI